MKLLVVWLLTPVLATVLLPACAAERGERQAQQDRLTLYNLTPTAVRVWIDVSNPERAGAPSLVLDGPWEVPSASTIAVRLGQYAEYVEHQRRIGGAYRVGSTWWVEVPDGSGPLAGVYQLMGMITDDGLLPSLLAGDGTTLQGQGFAPFIQVRAQAVGLPTAPTGAAAVEPVPGGDSELPDPKPIVSRGCDIQAIMTGVLSQYAAEHGIAVEPGEVADFTRWLESTAAECPDLKGEDSILHEDEIRPLILHWKVSAAVYREYGGDVSYHLLPPVYPVGAFERLVADDMARGALVLDEACRAKLRADFAGYARVTVEHDPFSTPYWREAAMNEFADGPLR